MSSTCHKNLSQSCRDGQPCDEVFLECGNGAFGSIDAMVVERDKVNVCVVGFDGCFHCLSAFFVYNVEGGLVSAGCKGGKNIGKGGNHGSIFLGGHSINKDGIEVINVHNKDVLHGFEGDDLNF
jgi:hypothetical protein